MSDIINMDKYRKPANTITNYVKNQTVGSFTANDIMIWADLVKTWFDSGSAIVGLRRGDDGDIMYIVPCERNLLGTKTLSWYRFFIKSHFKQLVDKDAKYKMSLKTMVFCASKMLKSEYKVEIIRNFPKDFKLDVIG
jgi:hypothetical protein